MMERTVMSIEKDRVDLEGILGKEDKDNAWQANEAIADSTERLLERVATEEDMEQLTLGDFAGSYTNSQIIAYQMGVTKTVKALLKEFLVLKRGAGREL